MNQTNKKGAVITHAGTVVFDGATGYKPSGGTGNWTVAPIKWPGLDPAPPVGQVQITFDEPLTGPYAVVVTAERSMDAPMLCANWGDATASGFVVVIFNPVATLSYRTVRNGNFSFVVIQ